MINFPNNPAVGDAFTSGGTIYRCVMVAPIVWNASPSDASIPDAPTDGKTYGRREGAWKALDKFDVGLDKVDNTADTAKPVSTPQQNALNLKENSIPVGSTSQYYRGDKTWQVITPATIGAVSKQGDKTNWLTIEPQTGTAQLILNKAAATEYSQFVGMSAGTPVWYLHMGGNTNDFGIFRVPDGNNGAPNALTINRANGVVDIPSELTAANGMGFRYDGGNANYLRMGSSHPTNWNWQWIRNSGALNWLGGSSNGLFSIDGAGNINAAGESRGGSLATAGAASVGTTMWAGGRITGAANDVAALYGSSGGSGIYTECGGVAAFRATQGGATVHPGVGYRVNSFQDQGGGLQTCYMLMGNPNWNDSWYQTIHVNGQWAGIRFWSSNGNLVDHYMSNGGSWGSVKAASFDVQSDERTKLSIASLDPKHDAFMSIHPISWKRNFEAVEGNAIPPERYSITDVDGAVHEPSSKPGAIYDDPDRIHWGFSAQNLTTAVRAAVNGDVKAVDAKGAPITAGVNPVPILAITVLEVQSLWRKIAELEETISQLKG